MPLISEAMVVASIEWSHNESNEHRFTLASNVENIKHSNMISSKNVNTASVLQLKKEES